MNEFIEADTKTQWCGATVIISIILALMACAAVPYFKKPEHTGMRPTECDKRSWERMSDGSFQCYKLRSRRT